MKRPRFGHRWGAAFGAALLLAGCATAAEPLDSTRWSMGTSLRVHVVDGAPEGESAAAFLDRVFAPAPHWESLLSTYRHDSVVARIHAATGDTVAVPTEITTYLQRAREDFERTEGLFDILHGSTPGGEEAWSRLHWGENADGAWVRAGEGVRIDPGGDGKGVAVDAMVEILREAGVEGALIDFGGSSWFALGRPAEAGAWRVEILDADERVLGEARWRDAALSISQTRLRGEAREHIVDPRRGELVRARRTAIVRAPTATAAEVLSTALIIRPDLALVDAFEGASAVILDGDRLLSSETATWFRPAR